MIIHDFETRSPVDIRKCGGYKYSEHPETKVLCLAYAFYDEEAQWEHTSEDDPWGQIPLEDVHIWHPAYPHLGIEAAPFPEELAQKIVDGEAMEAHNAFFERCIWHNVMRRDHPEFPQPKASQFRCSAAKASFMGLPRALDTAVPVAIALRLRGEDTKHLVGPLTKEFSKSAVGSRLMKKICKPRKPLKAEQQAFKAQGLAPEEWPTLWYEDREEYLGLFEYCRQDIRAEAILSGFVDEYICRVVRRGMRPRPNNLWQAFPWELDVWQADQEINWRGIRCDVEGAVAALKVVDACSEQMLEECRQITGGIAPGSRVKFKNWCHSQGFKIPNTQSKTIEKALKGALMDEGELVIDDRGLKSFVEKPMVLPDNVRRALEISQDLGRSSTAKYQAMLSYASDKDHRIRDLHMYCGAGNTGRWSGKGVQPHNFLRGGIKDMVQAWEDIKAADGDPDWLEILYSTTAMETVSHALRGALIPADGHDFVVADYSAIEARDVMWLSGSKTALRVFEAGEDIYCDMASGIYGHTVNKKKHPEKRFLGKQAILGLGYGMGFYKFLLTCLKYGIEFDLEMIMEILTSPAATREANWLARRIPKTDEGHATAHKHLSDLKKEETRKFLIPFVEYGRKEVLHSFWSSPRYFSKAFSDEGYNPKMLHVSMHSGGRLEQVMLMFYILLTYRERYVDVVRMWSNQNEAAKLAAACRGAEVICGGPQDNVHRVRAKIQAHLEGLGRGTEKRNARKYAYSALQQFNHGRPDRVMTNGIEPSHDKWNGLYFPNSDGTLREHPASYRPVKDAQPIRWCYDGTTLRCVLPSERPLFYISANLRKGLEDPDTGLVREWVEPDGWRSATVRYQTIGASGKPTRTHGYGGKYVENITQANARDQLADALVKAENSAVYNPVMHVHDELINEALKTLINEDTVRQFEKLISKGRLVESDDDLEEAKSWYEGCPVAAEGWAGPRYKKG